MRDPKERWEVWTRPMKGRGDWELKLTGTYQECLDVRVPGAEYLFRPAKNAETEPKK